MRCTVLCLFKEKGCDEFVFSSLDEVNSFYRKNKRKYAYMFIYTENDIGGRSKNE